MKEFEGKTLETAMNKPRVHLRCMVDVCGRWIGLVLTRSKLHTSNIKFTVKIKKHNKL